MIKYIFILLYATTFSFCIHATNYYVDGANGNDASDGKSWTTAKKTIDSTYNLTVPNDNVFVKTGTYNFSAVNLTTQDYAFFTMTNVNYYGGFAGTESNPSQRAKSDKDLNGTIDPWEFTNETILNFTLQNSTTMNAIGLNLTSNTQSAKYFDGFSITGKYTYSISTTGIASNSAISINSMVTFQNNTVRNWTIIGTVNAGSSTLGSAAYANGPLMKLEGNGALIKNCLFEKNKSNLTAGASQSVDARQSPFIRIEASKANASNAINNCTFRNNIVKVDFSTSPLLANSGIRGLLVDIAPSNTPFQPIFKNNLLNNNDASFICKTGKNFRALNASLLNLSAEEVPAEVPATYQPRDYFGAKLEPLDGVLHGAGQGDNNTTFGQYSTNTASTRPILYMCYINLNNTPANLSKRGKFLKTQIDPLASDVMLQLGLSFNGRNSAGKQIDSLVSLGYYDEQIDTAVAIMKRFNRPILIRIGFEFEGIWNAHKPAYYQSAFMRITDKIRAQSVNAATVWCSAGGSAGYKSLTELYKYYPGDAYVDWWGVDVFSATDITDTRLATFLNEAKLKKKPMLIGESTPRLVGVLDGKVSWDKWYNPYFNMIYQFPQIKAFCYINWDWAYWAALYNQPEWAKWGDGRIEQNPFVVEKYRKELKNSLFIHSAF
jgi:hypothetical protein